MEEKCPVPRRGGAKDTGAGAANAAKLCIQRHELPANIPLIY
jgi:hypothetical protein